LELGKFILILCTAYFGCVKRDALDDENEKNQISSHDKSKWDQKRIVKCDGSQPATKTKIIISLDINLGNFYRYFTGKLSKCNLVKLQFMTRFNIIAVSAIGHYEDFEQPRKI